MAVEKNRRYSAYTEKLLERVKKVYESGNTSRMEKIQKELTKAGDAESILTVGTSFLFGKNLPASRPQALARGRLCYSLILRHFNLCSFIVLSLFFHFYGRTMVEQR